MIPRSFVPQVLMSCCGPPLFYENLRSLFWVVWRSIHHPRKQATEEGRGSDRPGKSREATNMKAPVTYPDLHRQEPQVYICIYIYVYICLCMYMPESLLT